MIILLGAIGWTIFSLSVSIIFGDETLYDEDIDFYNHCHKTNL